LILCVLACHSLWVTGACACTYPRARARVRHPSMHVGIPASSSAPSGAVRSDCIAVPHASSQRAACFAAVEYSEYLVPHRYIVDKKCLVDRKVPRSLLFTVYLAPVCVRVRVCACVRYTSPSPPSNAPTRAPFVATAAALQASRAGACLRACAHVAGGSYATTCSIQRAAYNVQHTTCNVQCAACNMQHTTCNIQRATHNVQHTTCSIQRAAYSMKRAQMGPAELEKLYQIYQPSLLGELSAMAAVPPFPAHRSVHICAGIGLTPPTSAPGLGSPPPTSAPGLGSPPAHICAGTGLTPAHICAWTGLTPAHICAWTGPTPAHICAGTGPTPAHISTGTARPACVGAHHRHVKARTHRPERRSLQAHMARRMKFFNIIEKMPKDGCSASGGGGDGVQQARTQSECRCGHG
jgi:hypothetical protein